MNSKPCNTTQSSAFSRNKPTPSKDPKFFFVVLGHPSDLWHESVHESQESRVLPSTKFATKKLLATQFLRVPSKSPYRLILRVGLYRYTKMSATNKVPKGLNDSQCKKGNLGVHPPILYVPPMDLLQTKENTDTMKLKLLDGTDDFCLGEPR